MIAFSVSTVLIMALVAGLFAEASQTPSVPPPAESATGYTTVTGASDDSQISGTTTTMSESMYTGTPNGPGLAVSSVEEWNLNVTGYEYPPNFVSYDAVSGQIYLSGAGGPSNVVTVVDSTTHELSGNFSIPGTTYAGPILVSPEGTLFVFADVCEGEPQATSATCPPADISPGLFELNESTKAVIRDFPHVYGGNYAANFVTDVLYTTQTCPNPNGVVMDPDLSNCGYLNAYSLKSGALIANVSIGSPPQGIVADSQTNMVYLIAGGTFAGNTEELLTFNGSSDQVVSGTRFDTISTPVLQLDTDTDTVFALATNGSSTVVSAIDGGDGQILYSSPVGSACSVDSNRYYVNAATDQIYASGSNSTSGTDYFMVVNATNGHLENMVSTQGTTYEDSTSNPQTGQAYLLTSDQLVALPAEMTQTYVNPNLLTVSVCLDEPV